MKKMLILLVILMLCPAGMRGQNPVLLHSHNDYERMAPFWMAYSERFDSMEADVYCIDGTLFVSHDRKDVKQERTFEALYLQPLLQVFGRNGGRAWAGSEVNPYAVRVVMTGHVPVPADFGKYPDFIFFDGDLNLEYTESQLKRIALFSAPFFNYTQWRGRGRGSKTGWEMVMDAVERAHSHGKPIRFWGAPENETVYHVFYSLGIDYMNSDHPDECALFYRSNSGLFEE